MNTQGRYLVVVYLVVLISLMACAKKDRGFTDAENKALVQSSFFPGEMVQAAQTSTNTDGGVIGDNNGNQNGGDGGNVNKGETSTNTQSQNNTGSSTNGNSSTETTIGSNTQTVTHTQTQTDTQSNTSTDDGNIGKNDHQDDNHDGGNHDSHTDTDSDSDGGCHPHRPKVFVELPRMCTWHGISGKFFEQAKRPILTFEVVYQVARRLKEFFPKIEWPNAVKSSKHRLPYMPPKRMNLASFDLSRMSIVSPEHWKNEVQFDLREVQRDLPKLWKHQMLVAQVCDDGNQSQSCFDKPAQSMIHVAQKRINMSHIPNLISIDIFSKHVNYNHHYYDELPDYCEKLKSPLVLDLRQNGIQLSSAEAGVYFDIDDSRSLARTAWTLGIDDALLVRDLNHNGLIDSGAELFGSATRMPDGTRAANGFLALATLDSDHDGLFTANDETWNEVQLWIDKNHNGVSERTELYSLDEPQIKSIRLDYVEVQETDPHGNQTRQRTTFTRMVNGHDVVGLVIDAWFVTLTRY